jgi:hypothetical protein
VNSATNVVYKILAREFYRLNSGFFLFIGTLTFGFMSGIEHKALAEYFVSAPYLILIPVSVWIFYAGKILSFNTSQIYLPRNRALFHIPFLSPGDQWIITSQCFLLQFLPALAYGAFLSAVALRMDGYQSVLLIGMTLFCCCAAGSAIMIKLFHRPHREQSVSALKGFLDNYYQKPILQFYAEWLLRERTLQVAGIKLFNGALIWAICRLYAVENYDWRLMAMVLSACGIANLPLIFHLVRFEHIHISWIKNLPVGLPQRYLHLTTVAIAFLIPEWVVLVKYFPENLNMNWMVLTLVYAMSISLLLTGFAHLWSSGLEQATKKSFWIFIALILLILFKIPLTLLCIVNAGCGYLLFRMYYYAFEPYRGK